MNTTLRPRSSERGGILKIILLFLGAATLLLIIGIVAGGWYAKTKIDEAGGLQAFTGKMMGKGLDLMKPEIEKALNPEDRLRLDSVLSELQQAAPRLTEQQIQDIAVSIETLTQKMRQGQLSEADAKIFMDELSRLLHPPSDILDSGTNPPVLPPPMEE
jgi:hypothetical protein